ncbi:lauroyl-Kdo(2)-lipid IV(A) myristoyltransferase [Vibrio renipiscarius]|uniref:lauroyl-Kdo(2)-lipid IV(A) myristoyltransferase n=1 Tax=Vibrio renipiscarius TaxID=1461322 RepID=UPI0035509354
MSAAPRNDFDEKAYNPTFEWHFLAPKYWPTWLLVLLSIPIALLPLKIRHSASCVLAKYLTKSRKGTILNAWVNLKLCFPNKTDQEREAILYHTLVTAGVFMSGFGLLTLRGKAWLHGNCTINGLEHISNTQAENQQAILLVPHTWAIDIPAILLASMEMPVSAMAKKQKNEVLDWLMHRQRVQYGGRVYERSGGVKPFIKSVRDGYLGYYLPDQDHGPEHSIFVDFFATTKATLPGLGKLSKVCRAKIIPVYAMIDANTGHYIVNIEPPFDNFPTESEELDARAMNGFIEKSAGKNPEQYMWILRLLKTQPDGKNHYRLEKEQQEK